MKALTASELRIGNAYFDPFDAIEKFLSLEDMIYVCNYERMTNRDLRFEAIPLTEEWLIKFDCKKLAQNHWETPKGLQFNFFEDSNCGLITFGPRHVNFWHVHTFQNIVSLTGEAIKETVPA